MTTALATDTAALYLRISNDKSGERAGVERQRADCEALADRLGLTVVDVYEDNDKSAYSGKPRPDFERLLNDAADGRFGTVVCWASDRLYRRMADLVRITAELAPHVTIATVMGGEIDLETAEGIRNAQYSGVAGEFESRRKGERLTARAKQRALEEGRSTTSTRPFGWTWADPDPSDPTRPRPGSRAGLVPDPVEAPALAQAYRDVADGRSLIAAFRRLSAVVDVAKMDPTQLGAVLRNPRHGGLVAYKGDVVGEAADGLRIVDRALYEAVAAILADPSRRTTTGRPAGTMLGGGLLRCGRCGGPMAASNKHDATGKVPVYLCTRNHHLNRRRALLDPPVLELVGDVLAGLAEHGLLAADPAPDDRMTVLRQRIAAAEGRLDALAGLLAAGSLDPADFARATVKVRADIDDATAQLTKRAGRPAVAKLTADTDARAAWTALVASGDHMSVRQVLGELLDSITADTDRGITLHWREWVGPAPAHPAGVTPALDVDTRRQSVARLHADGRNLSQIARELGVNRQTVRRDLKVMGVDR